MFEFVVRSVPTSTYRTINHLTRWNDRAYTMGVTCTQISKLNYINVTRAWKIGNHTGFLD